MSTAVKSVIEEWRSISGHPGYEVSNLGRVRSLDRFVPWTFRGRVRLVHHTGRILRPTLAANGYLYANLAGKIITVHSLVAMTFIGPRPQGTQVAHFDGNRANACLTNLRYATPKENESDKIRHGISQSCEDGSNAKLTRKQVRRIRALGGILRQRDIAVLFSISQANVSTILARKTWTAA